MVAHKEKKEKKNQLFFLKSILFLSIFTGVEISSYGWSKAVAVILHIRALQIRITNPILGKLQEGVVSSAVIVHKLVSEEEFFSGITLIYFICVAK